jgi:ADP-ribose pyrophosphatase
MREIYRGQVVHLFVETATLPNGKQVELEVIRHPGAAAVVPLLDNGDVVLVHQYRHVTGGYLYEIPAGKRSPGEAPEACAHREVEEETGFRIGSLRHMTTIYTAPGFCDEQIHIYLARGLTHGRQQLDEHEVLNVVVMPLDEAIRKIQDQTIRDAKSIVGLMGAMALLK